MKTINTIKAILLAITALACFGSMLLPVLSETFITSFGANVSAGWSAMCFVLFIFFCSGLSEVTFGNDKDEEYQKWLDEKAIQEQNHVENNTNPYE